MNKTKRCGKCGETLPASGFYKDSTKPDGLQSNCIDCRRKHKGITQREAARVNARNALKAFKLHWGGINKDWTASRLYREEMKRQRLERGYARDRENPERKKARSKKWRENNPEKVRELERNWIKKNPGAKRRYNAISRERNKDRWNKARRDRKRSDPMYDLKTRLRSRTRHAFKYTGYKKRSKTAKLIGCPWEMLKAHIESLFTEGMTWENRSEWHIDHIIPLASAKNEEELINLCHFSNLQPLWAKDNLSKSATIITCQPELPLKH